MTNQEQRSTEDDTPEALEARCWALRERAERAESERDKTQDAVDDEWLDAIGTCYDKLTGQPWETRDGETASEGRLANIGALFRLIEEARAERDKALAACGAYRDALYVLICRIREWHPDLVDHPDHTDLGEALAKAKSVYESSDCGKGWTSPQDVADLQQGAKLWSEKAIAYQSQVQLLVEALEKELEYHKAYTHSEECETDKPFDTAPGDCTCGKTECFNNIANALAAVKGQP